MSDALEEIARHRVVPVVVIDDVRRVAAVARGLHDGGLPIAEVTFRTPAAREAIAAMAADPQMLVGAGTVLTAGHVDDAVDAGARFIVSPGVSRAVIRHCGELGVPVIPGAVTASEIMQALDQGIDLLKFFPAETAGGVAAIKALSAPFPQCRFVPTGGVNAGNAASYLDLRCVTAVGGSWMVPTDAVSTGDSAAIAALVRDAVSVVAAVATAATRGEPT
jgi:2-dehydro-3-deoxyphosphogluconate aldolase / (4S)-4-hydroxy-2-oxoglutarate aldolase